MTALFLLPQGPEIDMADYVTPDYSRSQIEAAGKLLKGTLTDVNEAVETFRIAHNWRDAHLFPMRRVRNELGREARRAGVAAITVARIKRMKSIRKKLRETPLTLYQLQDIGGARAIVGNIADLRRLVAFYQNERSTHGIIKHWPYIDAPKIGGYRSHHVSLKFHGDGREEIYNRQRIEVQLRTRIQHIWGTAVEAAGTVLGEDLKGGKGNADWLRLFEIMAAEMAALEGCPGVPGVSDNARERRQELRHLAAKLDASAHLYLWNDAIKFTDEITQSTSKFYVVQYDREMNRVLIFPALRVSQGSETLIQEEHAHEMRDSVLVEIDRAEDLRTAYPNYFLDVRTFAQLLDASVAGKNLADVSLGPILMPVASAPNVRKLISYLQWGRWRQGLE